MKAAKILSLIFMSCVFVCASTCLAAVDSHRAAVEEMLHLTEIDKMIDPMMEQVQAMIQNQVDQMDLTEEAKPVVKKYNDKIMLLMKTELAWEKMKNDLIDIYISVYTEEEIKAIIAFYRTPVGQKMLDKMPQLLQQTMAVTQSKVQQLIPDLQAISQDMENELQQIKPAAVETPAEN